MQPGFSQGRPLHLGGNDAVPRGCSRDASGVAERRGPKQLRAGARGRAREGKIPDSQELIRAVSGQNVDFAPIPGQVN